MKVINLLKIFESNPFLLYYYAFSMLLTVSMGQIFMRFLGMRRLWIYFFAVIVHILSFFGAFSLIMLIYSLLVPGISIHPAEILIPFFTMLLALALLRKKINLASVLGSPSFWQYYLLIVLLMSSLILIDEKTMINIREWSIWWVLILLMISMISLLSLLKWLRVKIL